MSYLKPKKTPGRARFPVRTSSTPPGVCKHCNEKISKENRLHYIGASGYKKECKPCVRKISREKNRKRYQTIKNNPLW